MRTFNLISQCNSRIVASVLALILLLICGSAFAERRVALVIGNSGYSDAPLRNPLNDARDMSRTLESFGFTVTRLEDADQHVMEQAIRSFGKELGEGTVGLFYYAGHGVQVDGENYLMPVDAKIETETDVVYDTVPLGRVLDSMSRSGGGLNLVILDACRNNPFTRSFRSSSRGLARASPGIAGTMILYATEPGQVAADGVGRNGLFTGELLGMLEEAPELKVEQLFKQTTSRVYQKTGGKQSPWSEGVIRGDFSFGQAPENAEPSTQPPRVEIADLSPTLLLQNALWEAVQKDNSERSYQRYLEQFPESVFSGVATDRMLRLREARELREAQRASEQAKLREEQQQRTQAQAQAEREAAEAEQRRQEDAQLVKEQAALLLEAKVAEKSLALSRDWRRGVQVGLNQAGMNVGTPDGLWGARTREGIQRWQAASGFPETGYLNEAGYRQMVAELGIVEVSPPRPIQQFFEQEMVRIEGARYKMGSTEGSADEKPVHGVTIRSFELGKYEVTVGQWRSFVEHSGYVTDADRNEGAKGCYSETAENGKFDWVQGRNWKDPGFSQGDNHPVVCISWNDAQNYVRWLNTKTSGGYRLPSEAEWEFAARAGSVGKYYFGEQDAELCRYGNVNDQSTAGTFHSYMAAKCSDGHVYTSRVGSYLGNPNSLQDMHGNAWEWTEDCWHENYEGAPADGSAWVEGGDCGRRVLRGGSWFSEPSELRSANRNRWSFKWIRYNDTGFRLSRTLNK